MSIVELWDNLTFAQGLVIVAAAWLITGGVVKLVSAVRRLLGYEPEPECCENCDAVDVMSARLDRIEADGGDR